MVSALNSRASGLVLSPGWGYCVVFLGKTFYQYSHCASLYPDLCINGYSRMLGVNTVMN